ncbi:Spy/CpxP family protein refolding chaperone [Vibrio rhizosphaerae]|uniref:Spy/CpxP family protein refolding chaperone n=1 Tax=Vibrio rhizosphaerae TaxID=398736 RepID=A0ABU4IQC8_9VIBR|nr:Spy/CpxP family protein refolding chaperone [Vibrio rhizosphaerae]MDW6091607.1 Spy/CpxP family protein refolding chaperone [Vibrio rhizosphaerae]
MSTLTKVILAAAILPLTLGSMNVFAGYQGHHGGGHWGNQRFDCQRYDNRGMLRSFNLTSEQQNQLTALRQKHWEQRQARMQDFHQEMAPIVLAKNFDEQAAQELAGKMENARIDRRVEMMRQRHDMLSILTPEQQQQWQKVFQERPYNNMAGPGQGAGGNNGPRFMMNQW